MNKEQECNDDPFEDTIIETSEEIGKVCAISGLCAIVASLPYISPSLKEILIRDFIYNKKYEKVIVENAYNIVNNIILSSKK